MAIGADWIILTRAPQETLDAQTEFTSDEVDGRTYHRINQYIIVEEVGRGSYGAVHRATDQFGKEFVRVQTYRCA